MTGTVAHLGTEVTFPIMPVPHNLYK
jgi:hypothetical protein